MTVKNLEHEQAKKNLTKLLDKLKKEVESGKFEGVIVYSTQTNKGYVVGGGSVKATISHFIKLEKSVTEITGRAVDEQLEKIIKAGNR